ncbi:helix-turn-helix transcriptional regulator [Cupriavidus sp. CuC1]|uniref:helix-turn-helix transcriptional regulator n=1 Tax=Cupriavidus sp. CuC1 TaxID=3373131 RepID=UPI0037D921CC
MNQNRRLLRLPEVIATTGRSRASIYKDIAEGKFPPPIRIGERAVAWPSDVVQGWVDERIEESRKLVAA